METFSPIQVVLDARQFQTDRKRTAGGSAKEFFEHRNDAFVEHKHHVADQLEKVRSRLLSSSAGQVGFIKVRMREEALAKSHRPVQKIFHPNNAPLAGSSGEGELIVQVSPQSIKQALQHVARAEETLRYRAKRDKPEEQEPAPSRERSEVGAIQSIQFWDARDRRAFSAEEALNWLRLKGVPKAYRVDLFDTIEPASKSVRQEVEAAGDLTSDLMTTLDENLPCGYIGALFRPDNGSMLRLYIWLLPDPKQRFFVHASKLQQAFKELPTPSLQPQNHQFLLDILGKHPAVRRISLPSALRSSAQARVATSTGANTYVGVMPQVGAQYPVVGIIDGGIGTVHSAWVPYAAQGVPTTQAIVNHGCEIAGLLVAGQSLNGIAVSPEPDGCLLADLAMVPHDTFYDQNYRSDLDFVLAIEQEVKSAKAAVNARVFCFSHNFENPPGYGGPQYPDLSAGLDRIAREQDVIFVVSAGNTEDGTGRQEWHIDPMIVLSDLASVNGDGITAPADALFAVSVGALNPPSTGSHVPHAPARYSRRGSFPKHFVKPDVVHYGGLCKTTSATTGLTSTSPAGKHCFINGTSYSGPLAAKTLARLDMLTGSRLPREALTALLIHGARQPACLSNYDKRVARQLVGFGLPVASDQLLAGAPHQATILFYDDMQDKKDLFFNFDWPQSLVENGKCRGEALLTLVYTPPIEDSHDDELVRINLEAVLHQRNKQGKWTKQSEDTFAAEPNKAASAMEKHLIEEGLKWGTVKQVRFASPNGTGISSEWRVCVKYLTRASELFPEAGIPFAAVLTIQDPKAEKPVYQDMKIGLTSRNVLTSDVRTTVQAQVQAKG